MGSCRWEGVLWGRGDYLTRNLRKWKLIIPFLHSLIGSFGLDAVAVSITSTVVVCFYKITVTLSFSVIMLYCNQLVFYFAK